jgi:hypothetical protein
LSTQGFALVNVGLVLIWLGIAMLIGRHYKRLTASSGA